MISSAWLKHGYLMGATLVYQVFSFTKGRTKNKKTKRHSGGITVLVRKEIRKGVKFFSSSSTRFVWCKLDKHFFNLEKDVDVCSAYIPPVNSVYIKNNSRDQLLNTVD